MMEVPDVIIENTIVDWKKKDVHPVDKGKLLESYCKYKRISQRELARRTGMSFSTLQDWMMFSKYEKNDYDELLRSGHSKTEIYKLIRENKAKPKEEVVKITYTDSILKKFISELQSLRREKKFSSATVWLIKQAKDELNHLEMYVDKK